MRKKDTKYKMQRITPEDIEEDYFRAVRFYNNWKLYSEEAKKLYMNTLSSFYVTIAPVINRRNENLSNETVEKLDNILNDLKGLLDKVQATGNVKIAEQSLKNAVVRDDLQSKEKNNEIGADLQQKESFSSCELNYEFNNDAEIEIII